MGKMKNYGAMQRESGATVFSISQFNKQDEDWDNVPGSSHSHFSRISLWALVAVIFGLFGLGMLDTSNHWPIRFEKEPFSNFEAATLDEEKTNVPNIIFLMIDDQGHGDMGYINPQLRSLMPNIVSLAESGIKMTKYYTDSLCTPARASFMTGKYSIHTGMQHELINTNDHWGLPLGNPILPQMLKNHGYITRMVGKWHLGFFQPAYIPTNRGFDSHFGYYGGQENYYAHSTPCQGRVWTDWQRDGYPAEIDDEDDGFSLTAFANEVDHILVSHDQSKPLFLYYATQATHAPLANPPEHYLTEDQLDYIKELTGNNGTSMSQRDLFLRTSVALDKTIGQMLETLKSTGMYENTIIMAASDNGGCAYYGADNWPLRGEKRTQWEGGVRTNAFIHSPLLSQSNVNTTYSHLFHVTDWVPTILYGILGNSTESKNKKYDGVNHWSAIQDVDSKEDTSPAREQILHIIEIMDISTDAFIAAYRHGDYKLVFGEFEMPIYTPQSPEKINYCETDGSYGTQTSSVYNVVADGTESINIIEKISDNQLKSMWHAIDGFFDSSVKSAYNKETDFRYKKVWLDHDGYTVPWIHYKEDEERVHLPVPDQ